MDIWQAETGEYATQRKYEDDCCVVRFPNSFGPFPSGLFLYRFDRASIITLIDPVGTPCHPVKTGDKFLDTIIFLGFLWDFVLRRVSLPDAKREKFLARVRDMISGVHGKRKFALVDLQGFTGPCAISASFFPRAPPALPSSPMRQPVSRETHSNAAVCPTRPSTRIPGPTVEMKIKIKTAQQRKSLSHKNTEQGNEKASPWLNLRQ